MSTTCPTCGQRVAVEGDAAEGTMHYVGVEAEHAAEAFLTGQQALERRVAELETFAEELIGHVVGSKERAKLLDRLDAIRGPR